MLKTNPSGGIINNSIHKVIWLEITRRAISKIRLYICDEKGKLVSLNDKPLYCTLLFIPNRKIC